MSKSDCDSSPEKGFLLHILKFSKVDLLTSARFRNFQSGSTASRDFNGVFTYVPPSIGSLGTRNGSSLYDH